MKLVQGKGPDEPCSPTGRANLLRKQGGPTRFRGSRPTYGFGLATRTGCRRLLATPREPRFSSWARGAWNSGGFKFSAGGVATSFTYPLVGTLSRTCHRERLAIAGRQKLFLQFLEKLGLRWQSRRTAGERSGAFVRHRPLHPNHPNALKSI